jgi:hypothetical protein
VDPRLMQVGRDIFRGIVVCATGIRNKVMGFFGCEHGRTQTFLPARRVRHGQDDGWQSLDRLHRSHHPFDCGRNRQ